MAVKVINCFFTYSLSLSRKLESATPSVLVRKNILLIATIAYFMVPMIIKHNSHYISVRMHVKIYRMLIPVAIQYGRIVCFFAVVTIFALFVRTPFHD